MNVVLPVQQLREREAAIYEHTTNCAGKHEINIADGGDRWQRNVDVMYRSALARITSVQGSFFIRPTQLSMHKLAHFFWGGVQTRLVA